MYFYSKIIKYFLRGNHYSTYFKSKMISDDFTENHYSIKITQVKLYFQVKMIVPEEYLPGCS